MECPKCHKFVEDSWKICPHCRTQLSPVQKSEEEQNNPLQVYKNKAIWRIVPGEVARHIRESELDNFDQITGIIIEEGVSAYIYVDGTRVAELGSGAYEFTSKEEIDKILNERVGGLKNSKVWQWVVGLIKGKKVSDKVKVHEELKDAKSLEDVLHYMRQDSVVSIYLKLDKSFPLLFGIDGDNKYQPITVRTKYSDINVGLTMQLQVSDFNAFIPHYLVGRKNITRQDVQRELENEVEAVLRHQLASEIVDERGFDETLHKKIESELIGLNDMLNGISINRVVEISCENADFERFRALAKEIYIADREIDYMQRTQEMKNRVAAFENTQAIYEARSRYELEKALDEINKDGLLEKEELRQFVQSLDTQRKIKDAKSDFEVKYALNDLKRSGMLSDDEVDKLAADIQNGKIQRDSINEVLMIQAQSRANQAKLDAEILLQQMAKDFAREDSIRDARTEDEIERIRIERERELANDSMERLRRMKQIQLEGDEQELRMKRIDEMERKDQDYHHQEKIHEMDSHVEIHKIDSREREAMLIAEKEREARERDETRNRELNEERKNMYQELMGNMKEVTLAGFAAAGGKNPTGKENADSKQEAPHKENKKEYFVLSMGNVPFTLAQVRSFVLAGLVKTDSLIRIDGQDWQAGTLSELADLFAK